MITQSLLLHRLIQLPQFGNLIRTHPHGIPHWQHIVGHVYIALPFANDDPVPEGSHELPVVLLRLRVEGLQLLLHLFHHILLWPLHGFGLRVVPR